MVEYHDHGVNLSKGQVKKMHTAHKMNRNVTIKLSKNNIRGNHKLPLTKTQLNRINKTKTGIQLTLSECQLKHMEKTGGFLPLLSLIPLVLSGIGAAGGIAGGISSAVNAGNNARATAAAQAETERHNREIETQLRSGSGVVSDFVEKVPVIGKILGPLLQKIGLGTRDINKIKRGGCICWDGIEIKRYGNGLFLGPQGSGLFLGPERS